MTDAGAGRVSDSRGSLGGMARCFGDGDPLYEAYHDDEWGVELHGDVALFERITLEGAQSGLSWITVLRKRDGYREAFEGFSPERVAAFDETDVDRLMGFDGIIRNRRKIESTIANARALMSMHESAESLDDLFWSLRPDEWDVARESYKAVPATTPESVALAKALKKRGFAFVGPTTMYAAMQACGVVNDHLAGCPARR